MSRSRIVDFADGFTSSVEPTSTSIPASTIPFTPDAGIASTNVQDAIVELEGMKADLVGGKVPVEQIPAIAVTSVSVVADIAARDALTVEEGDVAKVLDDGFGNNATYIYDGSSWQLMQSDAALALHEADASTHGVSGDLVGTTDTQTLSNKDFDGGTASNSSRLTVPKNTLTNLQSLTRKEGTLVYSTDQQKAYVDNGSSLIPVGSGSGGSLNYIENPDAETDTTGWATYADAAGSAPVDGTGGSPNVNFTFERSTSSPLRGTASFLLSKDANDRRGHGVSYDFTIDSADQAKVMQIGFDYAVASGTYATGDLAIYIVDVTNSTVTQPSAYQVENVGVNSTARLTFQTASNSTSYRLCFHVASTSASAYSLKFDNIQLGPQVVPLGAPVTDWVSYTPTMTWVSGATVGAHWRRVGDTLEVTGRVSVNSGVTAAELNITIPSGLAIDTAKLISTTRLDNIGEARVRDDDALAVYDGFVRYASTTSVAIFAQSTAGSSNSALNNTVPFTWANNDTVMFEFRVPIVGWSSSTVVSSSANTRVVAAQITGTPTSSLTGSYSTATWASASVVVDTHGAFDAATGTYTAPVPGLYKIEGCVEIARSSGSATQAAAWRVNNVTQAVTRVAGGNTWISSGGEALSMTGSTLIRANGGDQIRIQAYSAGSGTAYNAGFTGTNISINLLQGPSQIQASEQISMVCYKNTGSHTSTGNFQDVASWNAVTKDSHGGFNATTGIYTCPATGDYHVNAKVAWATNATGFRQMQVMRDGAYVSVSPDVTGAVSGAVHHATVIPNCVAGTQIKLMSFQNSGGNLAYNTSANFTEVQIYRLGGV